MVFSIQTRSSDPNIAGPESDDPARDDTPSGRLLEPQHAVRDEAIQSPMVPVPEAPVLPAPGQSTGEPIQEQIREPVEQRLDQDLSDVRVHTDTAAAESAQVLGAEAYTTGRDIYFAAGKYAPETAQGRQLLVHELVHTVQQRGSSGGQPTRDAITGTEEGTLEAEAFAASGLGTSVPSISPAQGVGIQRQKSPGAAAPSSEAPVLKLPWDSVTLDYFASDKADLTAEHREKLADVAKSLLQILVGYPNTFISIVGHTDATDTEKHNKELGQKRADAVKSALVWLGVPTGLMNASSLGESALQVDTQGPEPRNRRVEIHVFRRSFFAERQPKPPAPAAATPGAVPSPALPVRPPPIVVPPEEKDPTKLPPGFWKEGERVEKLRTQRREEAARLRFGGSISEAVENFVDAEMRRMRLPDFLRDKVKDLASTALEKGLTEAFKALAIDTRIDAKFKDGIQSILKGVLKYK
jgi:outer membrane protein OmpA-like peptidoglycan-associated protein